MMTMMFIADVDVAVDDECCFDDDDCGGGDYDDNDVQMQKHYLY
jgi:hypothetical protein